MRTWSFDSVRDAAGQLRLTFDRATPSGNVVPDRVLWHSGAATSVFDADRAQYQRFASSTAALAIALPALGSEALIVPALLLGLDPLAEPEGAALDGPEDCHASSCWVLSLSWMAGTVASQVWIDRESHLVRQVEVRALSARAALDAAAQAAGLATHGDAAEAEIVTVIHHPVSVPSPTPMVADFEPPAAAQRVDRWLPAAADSPGCRPGPRAGPPASSTSLPWTISWSPPE